MKLNTITTTNADDGVDGLPESPAISPDGSSLSPEAAKLEAHRNALVVAVADAERTLTEARSRLSGVTDAVRSGNANQSTFSAARNAVEYGEVALAGARDRLVEADRALTAQVVEDVWAAVDETEVDVLDALREDVGARVGAILADILDAVEARDARIRALHAAAHRGGVEVHDRVESMAQPQDGSVWLSRHNGVVVDGRVVAPSRCPRADALVELFRAVGVDLPRLAGAVDTRVSDQELAALLGDRQVAAEARTWQRLPRLVA